MLSGIDFTEQSLDKGAYKKRYKELVSRLVLLQQKAHEEGVGLVVLFEGWNGAGKGSRISDLLYNLDARVTSVHVTPDVTEDEVRAFPGLKNGVTGFYPFLHGFWEGLGPRGNITFYDRGWYAQALSLVEELGDRQLLFRDIESFERQLTADGYLVVKFFLHIPAESLRERLELLYADPLTRWRVGKKDLTSLVRYDHDFRLYEQLLDQSNFDFAPWTVLNGKDKHSCNLTIVQTLVDVLEARLSQEKDPQAQAAAQKAHSNSEGTLDAKAEELSAEEKLARAQADADAAHALAPTGSRFALREDYPRLDQVDYGLVLDQKTYKKQLRKEQKRLFDLEMEMYQARVPMIIMYEGQDAAGKGGSIKRVAQALDARAYNIFPSPAPTKPELMHPFLWRYWTRLPKAGHVGIYDRSWYGRVLVERVEGFASTAEWTRAYDEINEFEQALVDWGAILVKFWVEISPEEQLARFRAREEDPAKQWKITAEDWRNREKAPQYQSAIQDMLRLTSTEHAPWHVLESEDKKYARVKALKIINDALEQRLHGA